MKILWAISLITPDVSQLLGSQRSEFGGWVQSMLDKLSLFPDVDISVVGCASVKKVLNEKIGNIKYYILPIVGKNRSVSQDQVESLVNKIDPDIIHIQGTEYSISNSFANIKSYKNVVYIQGLLTGCMPYLYGEIPLSDFMFSWKLYNLLIGWPLFFRKILFFNQRLSIEVDTIKKAQNFIGRTVWDRAHTYNLNKNAKYYLCNENLRPFFYENRWDYYRCRKCSIFVGNAYAALKGGHYVYEAVSLLQEEFPDVHLVVAGAPPHDCSNGLKSNLGYGLYTQRLLKKYNLESKVTFTGILDGEKMADKMLQSNVYVLSSTIENSPNTLAEAMCLGVPAVVSYAGGVPSMARAEEEVLFYRANDPVMLAWQIRRVFLEGNDAKLRADKARKRALDTHNSEKNAEVMLSIYKQILDDK